MQNEYNCPVDATISKIGGKYKAQQLRELESDNLIIKKIYPVIPPKTEYSLSELGKTLIPLLDFMCEWGQQFMGACEKISVKSTL